MSSLSVLLYFTYEIHKPYRIGATDVIDLEKGGRIIDDPDGAFDNVINIGEVPDHVTSVENLYRLTLGDRRRKQHRTHVRSPPGTVNRKETETG